MNEPLPNVPPPNEGGFSYLRTPFALILFISALLIAIALWMPSPIAGIDSGIKWLAAENFAETNSLAIPPPPHAVFQQNEFPPCPEPFLFWNRGELLPVYPVLPILLNGLIDKVAGSRLWWFWTVVPTIVLIILLRQSAKQLQFSTLTAMLVLLCATPLTVYAVTYWEHALAGATACIGIVLLLRQRLAWSMIGAFLLGVAPWVRPELIGWSILAWLFAFGFLQARRWVAALFAIACGLGCGAALNHLFTGSFLPLQVIANFETGQTLWSNIAHGVFPYRTYLALFFGAGSLGMSIILLALTVVGLVGWRKQKSYAVALVFAPILYVISRILEPLPVFSMIRANGLFFTMPALLLAPWGWRRLPHARIWLGACAGLLLMVLAMGEVAEGIHWSVRFLLPIAFPMTIAAMLALRETPFPFLNRMVGLVGIVALTVYGIVWYVQIEAQQVAFQSALRSDPALIASDVAWVGGDAAPLLREQEIVFIQDREQLARFVLTLQQKGIDRFQFVRMMSAMPLTDTSDGNWSKLMHFAAKRFAPTPERGQEYRIELYRLTNDSIAYGQLAGELAALRFARGDARGVADAKWAIRRNPRDYRPVIELLAYGVETKNIELIREEIAAVQTFPVPQKYRSLIEKGIDIVNAASR